MADLVVTHGGQGTVQAATAVRTPVVGVGFQMEQQIKLNHCMDDGAGIRIPQHNQESGHRDSSQLEIQEPSNSTCTGETDFIMDGARDAGGCMREFLLDP